MKELEILLNHRWVLKAEDKELYYRVRDEIGEIRKFASEKMGCQITENALLVKMEKIPAVPIMAARSSFLNLYRRNPPITRQTP